MATATGELRGEQELVGTNVSRLQKAVESPRFRANPGYIGLPTASHLPENGLDSPRFMGDPEG